MNPHLRRLVEDAAKFSKPPGGDRFPPRHDPQDGELLARINSSSISYYFFRHAFVKRQPHVDELGLDIYGVPCVNPYIADRLRNEAAALQFVAAHAPAVPVPTFLDLWEQDGLVYLKTAMVTDGVELGSLEPADAQARATVAVLAQLHGEILPQLHGRWRSCIGSADPRLPVVPPNRFWRFKDQRVWPRVEAVAANGDGGAGDDAFVFCHNDLDRQNILVDPATFRITCIIDWEAAGFFPAEFDVLFLEA